LRVVFGAPAIADTGKLIFVPAGPKSSVDKLRPYVVDVMGRAIIPFDDKPYASAAKLKLIGNTCVMNMITQVAEAFVVSEKAGMGTTQIKMFIDLFFGGPYTAYADRMLEGTYWKMEEPLFSANDALRNTRNAMHIAESVGAKVKNPNITIEYLEAVAKSVGGDRGDITGTYGAVREANGLKYENDA
jgi:3-hydroxyisobutyrate dehydrogenase-like beta-hydroxyacid dehydrogenase